MHYRRIINRFIPLLSAIPYTRAFFLVGSVANGSANKDSDIDIVVYAKRNRVWLNRVLMDGAAVLVGRRRTSKKRAGRFCFNATVAEGEAEKIILKIHPRAKRIDINPWPSRTARSILEFVLEILFLGLVLDRLSQKILEKYVRSRFSVFGNQNNAVLILERNLIAYHPPR